MGILHADAPTLHGGHAVDEPVVLAILGCLEKGEVVVSARRKSQTWGGGHGGSWGVQEETASWDRSAGQGIFHEGRCLGKQVRLSPRPHHHMRWLWQTSRRLSWSCA